MEAFDGEPGRFSRNKRCCATIAEDHECQNVVQIGGFLEVQRTKLQVHHQHAGVRLRAHDVTRDFQRVHRCIAAHEPDHRPLDGRRQSASLDNLKIQTWRRETGTARDHKMRNFSGGAVQSEARNGRFGQQRRVFLKCPHPSRGAGELPPRIELRRGQSDFECPVVRNQIRESRIDAGAICEAPKDSQLLRISFQQTGRKSEERMMHIMWRNCRRDAVDIRSTQSIPPRWRVPSGRPI